LKASLSDAVTCVGKQRPDSMAGCGQESGQGTPDIREYRENQLQGTGIKRLFPIWTTATDVLAGQMFSSGVEAYISWGRKTKK